MANVPVHRGNRGSTTPSRMGHPLDLFRRQMDALFDSFWGGPAAAFDDDFGGMRLWDFDVSENDKEVVVRAEVPGFEENELDVQLSNDMLTIKAEKQEREEGREEYRNFYRTVMLPSSVDAGKAQATYRNGVLELHLPRTEESQAKRIPIQGRQAGTTSSATEKTAGNGGNGARGSEQPSAKTKK